MDEHSLKIDNKGVEDIFALTPMQEGILYQYLRNPEGNLYSEQLSVRLKGELDTELFIDAWNWVIKTNEALRTVFRWENVKNPLQIVLKEFKVTLKYHDFSKKSVKEGERLLEDLQTEYEWERFDLHHVPFRIALCKKDTGDFVMILGNHQILYDGWSTGIILNEFFSAYNNMSLKKTLPPSRKCKFKDFVKWMNRQAHGDGKLFWQGYFSDFDPPRRLVENSHSDQKNNFIVNFNMKLPALLVDRLESMANRHRITLASLFYSAWGILLHKYLGSRDVVFGIVVSVRPPQLRGIEGLVGLCTNTLPLRVKRPSNEQVIDLIHSVNTLLKQLENHAAASPVHIKESSGLNNQDELYDTVMVVENYPLDRSLVENPGEIAVQSYSFFERNHLDLSVLIKLFHDIEVCFFYNKEILDRGLIEAMSSHYRNILEIVSAKLQ